MKLSAAASAAASPRKQEEGPGVVRQGIAEPMLWHAQPASNSLPANGEQARGLAAEPAADVRTWNGVRPVAERDQKQSGGENEPVWIFFEPRT
jgi:hypothetical protein